MFSSRLALSLNRNANVATSRRFAEDGEEHVLEMHAAAPVLLAFGGMTSDEKRTGYRRQNLDFYS